MKRYILLLIVLFSLPLVRLMAQDSLWVRYDNRFRRHAVQRIAGADSIEVKASQLKVYMPTGNKTQTFIVDKSTVVFANPGRYLLKPNTYSGTNY